MDRLLVFNLATDESDPLLGFGVEWLRLLARRCVHVDVVTMRQGPADLPANVTLHSVGLERGLSEVRRAVAFYRILFGLLRRNRYDACFAHMMPLFAAMGAPFLRLRRVPLTLWYVHRATSIRLRLAHFLVNRVVTATADSFPLASEKVVVTGHGIDTDLFSPASRAREGVFTIFCPGRIAPIKRIEVLIRAVRELIADAPTSAVRASILGPVLPPDRPYAYGLRSLVGDLGLGDRIGFADAVAHADMVDRYREADVVVNLSDTDSLDKVVIEAMSCAIPVVTSNEACARLVARVLPELAVPKGDPAAVAAACVGVWGMDPQRRAQIGLALREIVVAEHSLPGLIDRLVEILPSTGKLVA